MKKIRTCPRCGFIHKGKSDAASVRAECEANRKALLALTGDHRIRSNEGFDWRNPDAASESQPPIDDTPANRPLFDAIKKQVMESTSDPNSFFALVEAIGPDAASRRGFSRDLFLGLAALQLKTFGAVSVSVQRILDKPPEEDSV